MARDRETGKTLFITEPVRDELQALQFRIQVKMGKRITYSQIIDAMCDLSASNYDDLINILEGE